MHLYDSRLKENVLQQIARIKVFHIPRYYAKLLLCFYCQECQANWKDSSVYKTIQSTSY